MTAVDELLGNFWFLLFATITITSVVGTIAHAWQKIRRAEAATRLQQAMLERGLSVDEMERLLRPAALVNEGSDTQSPAPETPLSEEQLVEKLANRLAGESASEGTIQQVMEAFHASDLPGKRLLYHAIFGLSEGFQATDEQILAVVRGLCRPDGQGVGTGQDCEPKLALPVAGGKWDSHGIRAEPGSAADRPRG
jgi:hypothetical protein